MAKLKTAPTTASVAAFLAGIGDEARRRDCRALAKLMGRVTGARPRMWGTGIVAFGDYHYKYASGREGDWFVMGFAPRKADLTLYLMPGLHECRPFLQALGRHRAGKGCLYIKRLADVKLDVLEALMRHNVERLRATARD
jgi:hypothetical protein